MPVVNQNLLKEDQNNQLYHQEALRQAQLKAQNAKNNELEFSRQLQETKLALEKEIHRQLVEQLTLRAQKKSVTPEQQALIEKLYLDLRLINPELAFATLKASAVLNEPQAPPMPAPPVPQRVVQAPPQVQAHQVRQSAPVVVKPRPSATQLVHNQGSIVNAKEEQVKVRSSKSSSSKSHQHKSSSSRR